MQIHSSITEQRVLQLAEDNNLLCMNMGICLACGEERESCEPDARNYDCHSCEENQVQGWMTIIERRLWNDKIPTPLADAIAQRANQMFAIDEEDKDTHRQRLEEGGIAKAIQEEEDEWEKMSLDEQADEFHKMVSNEEEEKQDV